MRSVREMAEEAGMYECDGKTVVVHYSPETLERFAALVRAEVLEEAAKVAENTWEADEGGDEESSGYPRYGENSARAIRALVKEK